jgi:hypothetical protein
MVTKTTSKNGVYVKDIGPFWGITPRYGVFPLSWTDQGQGQLHSYGVGVTGRINFLGADITLSRSEILTGVNENVIALNPIVKREFDNDVVRGVVNSTEISFEGTMNIVGLVSAIVKPQNYRDMGMKTTPLNRLNFHLGITRFNPGKVTYDNLDSAKAYTNTFFANNPGIERNEINDPMKHDSHWGVTYGVSYEMGVVGIGIYNRSTKTYGKSSMIEVYYIIPISKIKRAYSK